MIVFNGYILKDIEVDSFRLYAVCVYKELVTVVIFHEMQLGEKKTVFSVIYVVSYLHDQQHLNSWYCYTSLKQLLYTCKTLRRKSNISTVLVTVGPGTVEKDRWPMTSYGANSSLVNRNCGCTVCGSNGRWHSINYLK